MIQSGMRLILQSFPNIVKLDLFHVGYQYAFASLVNHSQFLIHFVKAVASSLLEKNDVLFCCLWCHVL